MLSQGNSLIRSERVDGIDGLDDAGMEDGSVNGPLDSTQDGDRATTDCPAAVECVRMTNTLSSKSARSMDIDDNVPSLATVHEWNMVEIEAPSQTANVSALAIRCAGVDQKESSEPNENIAAPVAVDANLEQQIVCHEAVAEYANSETSLSKDPQHPSSERSAIHSTAGPTLNFSDKADSIRTSWWSCLQASNTDSFPVQKVVANEESSSIPAVSGGSNLTECRSIAVIDSGSDSKHVAALADFAEHDSREQRQAQKIVDQLIVISGHSQPVSGLETELERKLPPEEILVVESDPPVLDEVNASFENSAIIFLEDTSRVVGGSKDLDGARHENSISLEATNRDAARPQKRDRTQWEAEQIQHSPKLARIDFLPKAKRRRISGSAELCASVVDRVDCNRTTGNEDNDIVDPSTDNSEEESQVCEDESNIHGNPQPLISLDRDDMKSTLNTATKAAEASVEEINEKIAIVGSGGKESVAEFTPFFSIIDSKEGQPKLGYTGKQTEKSLELKEVKIFDVGLENAITAATERCADQVQGADSREAVFGYSNIEMRDRGEKSSLQETELCKTASQTGSKMNDTPVRRPSLQTMSFESLNVEAKKGTEMDESTTELDEDVRNLQTMSFESLNVEAKRETEMFESTAELDEDVRNLLAGEDSRCWINSALIRQVCPVCF